MIRCGESPYLECSSKGDKRFFARIRGRENKSIEVLYQASKVFENGETNLSWKEAKGKMAINMDECNIFYSLLWKEYISENPELLKILKLWSGTSDIFGQQGRNCQAIELWNIRNSI